MTSAAPTRTATIDYMCKENIKHALMFYTLGMFRHVRVARVSTEEQKHCFDVYYGNYIFQTVIFISILLSVFIVSFLLLEGLLKSKKYSLLLYLNAMNLLLDFGVMFYVFYTFWKKRILTPSECLIKLQTLSISLQMYFLAVICVGVDCVIAVFYPLRYRIIATTKMFVKLNIFVFSLISVTQLFIPLFYAIVKDEREALHCETQVFQKMKNYYLGNQIFSTILLIASCSVNLTITGGVINSMVKRRELVSKGNNVVKQSFKLIFRNICLLGGNYSGLFLIFVYPFGILSESVPPSLLLSASMSVGIWNNVIFFFLDDAIKSRLVLRIKGRHNVSIRSSASLMTKSKK